MKPSPVERTTVRENKATSKSIPAIMLWETLDRIQSTLAISQDRWSDLLQLTGSEIIKLKTRRLGPSDSSLQRLADHLDIAPDVIREHRVDFPALLARSQGLTMAMPERYQVGAGSKRRTSIHLLDYLELSLGWRARHKILRRLQISEALLHDPDAGINIRFLTDLCAELKLAGFSDSMLSRMGRHSCVANSKSPVGDAFRSIATPEQVYERLCLELAPKYYDRNFHYSLRELTSTHALIETHCNPAITDALKDDRLGSQLVCAAKSGTFASIVSYLGLPEADVTEPECIHRGDAACVFRIDFQDAVVAAAQTQRKRIKPLSVAPDLAREQPGSQDERVSARRRRAPSRPAVLPQ